MNLKDHLVLYVDDSAQNGVVFEAAFSEQFRVKTVTSGAQALEILAREPVAVLVTDQRMPEMDGHELLRRAKSLHPDTIRVVITAYSDVDPILGAVNEGLVARYLIKPWEKGEIEEVLSWGIGAYVLGREDSAAQMRLLRTERLATLGSISSAVVHDLSEPLSSMHHNLTRLGQIADELQQQLGLARHPAATRLGELQRELAEIADESLHSIGVMLQMTDAIRRFGRPVAPGGEPPSCAPLEVIRQAMVMVRDLAVRSTARLMYEGPSTLPQVRMPAVELTQVLLNLLINANQAVQRTGRHGRVVVSASPGPEHLELAVSDDGAGIPAALLPKVGTPFFSTRPEGSGLGYAQCVRLVGRAGGSIVLRSEEHQGTVVRLRLPLS